MTNGNISSPILQVKGLYKKYDDLNETQTIIDGIDLTLNKNDFLCILGPSGCGKTTFLRCLAGFEKYQGEIKVDGVSVSAPNMDRIMVFQDFNQLFPWKTVSGNIDYPLKKMGYKSKEKRQEIISEYLQKVGLYEYKDYYPHQLSGGMKQRVAIAKALALRPKLILMDEPFASLDAMTRRKLQKELLRLSASENVTIIFITHNIQEAIVLGNRIMVMSRQGKFKLDMENHLVKPVTPVTEGYAKMWDVLNNALNEEFLSPFLEKAVAEKNILV